jgi:hypothetical protein
MTIDAERLRELAAELGYWPASTDEEHVARLRAQDAPREQERQETERRLRDLVNRQEGEGDDRSQA